MFEFAALMQLADPLPTAFPSLYPGNGSNQNSQGWVIFIQGGVC